MIGFSIQWVLFVLFWLLFVYQLALSELLVSLAASALTVVALNAALHAVSLCFKPQIETLAQGLRVPAMIAQDLWVVLKELCRRISGASPRSILIQHRFTAGADCEGSARRALAVLYFTSSPNSVVIDMDAARGAMLIHELVPAPVPALVRKLQE